MSNRPTITTLPAGGRYSTSTLNTNFQALRNEFDNVVGTNGVGGDNNSASANHDMNTHDIINVGQIFDTSGTDITGGTQVSYAKEWADKAEDSLVSAAAGGNASDDYSALHHSAKSAANVVLTAADLVLTNADVVSTNADVVLTNADVVLTNADVVTTTKYATKIDGAVTGTDFSSKAWAIGGTDVTDTASRGAAKEWAIEVEDNTVDGSGYSALHHSAKAAAQATAAASSASAAAASAAGIFWKEPVLCATTANITLSGEQTLDSATTTSTSRVLVKDQTATEENGVYITDASTWSRATPLDTWDEHVGAAVIVSEGSANGDSAYICTVDSGGTLETTSITWASLSQVYTTATTTAEGIVEFATNAEALTGTSTSLALSASNVPTIKGVAQTSKSTAYTLVLGDAGGHVFHPAADTTARTWTIPANSSVAYPIGTAITFVNETLGGVITIAITTDTLTFTDGTTGSRTLAASGICTALKVTSTKWVISGTGLT